MTDTDTDLVPIANPLDHALGYTTLWRLSFGAYGDTRVAVWTCGEDLEAAWEEAVEWLDHLKLVGHFVGLDDAELAEAAEDLGIAWPTEDDEERWRVYERAEVDLTPVSHTQLKNAGPGPWYVPSWEWTADEIDRTSDLYREVARRSIETAEADEAAE